MKVNKYNKCSGGGGGGSYDEGYNQGKTDGVNEQKSKLETINITENGTYAKEDGYNHIEVNVPDLNGSYDEGYAEGQGAGYNQGKTDGINEQKTKLGAINITENGTYTKEDGYNHIEVNVIPKINVKEAGLKFGRSTFTKVSELLDFKDVTDMLNMFSDCSNLQTVTMIDTSNVTNMDSMFVKCSSLQTIPLLNTSNVTNMNLMFGACSSLQTIPEIDTSNVTNMRYMFQGCSNLQTMPLLNTSNVTNMTGMFQSCSNLQAVPLLNTSNVTNMNYMFQNCSSLQTIPSIDTSNVTNMSHMFFNCSSLQTISPLNTSNVTNMDYMFCKCSNLRTLPELDASKVTSIRDYFSNGGSNVTDVGGWKNLKINWNDNNGLKLCPNLTHQSCINILNGLYDFVGNGSTETRTLKVHPNFLTTVGDEISIGTNKGWTITV